MWNLVCCCGTRLLKSSSDIGKLVATSSCGCYRKPRQIQPEKHLVLRPNKTAMPEYESWEAMRQRCNNSNYSAYAYYGGRGITIDPAWDDFWQFYADLGARPDGYTLDRRDVNLNYTKSNCRWETRSVQSYNTRVQCNNTSGMTGVTWGERDGRWYARLDFQGRPIYLGSSRSYDEACKLREDAELKYFGVNKPVGERLREVDADGNSKD